MKRFARVFLAAFAGGSFGCVAVVLVAACFGLGTLFLVPAFAILLGSAGLLATLLVGVPAGLIARRSSARSVAIATAILTALIVAAWVYKGTRGNSAGGPMFG